MARVIDITERLGLDGRPSIAIRGKVYEVNDTVPAVLQVMGIIGNGDDVAPDDLMRALDILLGKRVAKELSEELSWGDILVVLQAASELAAGGDGAGDGEAQGNAATPATT